MCAAQQILSVGAVKSLFSFLTEWLLLLHLSLSVKTTWPGGSVIRYGTHPGENICTRGAGCGGKGRVCANPSIAGLLFEASKLAEGMELSNPFHNQVLPPVHGLPRSSKMSIKV